MPDIDVAAQNAREWRVAAEGALRAACILFNGSPEVWFSAALLGHHALEMLIKSALIRQGFIVAKGKPENGFAWGHSVVELARAVASRCTDFNADGFFWDDLAGYDTFFEELRYPGILKNFDELGEHHRLVLLDLMQVIRPFSFQLPNE
jgi:HEPN domain-containing protein